MVEDAIGINNNASPYSSDSDTSRHICHNTSSSQTPIPIPGALVPIQLESSDVSSNDLDPSTKRKTGSTSLSASVDNSNTSSDRKEGYHSAASFDHAMENFETAFTNEPSYQHTSVIPHHLSTLRQRDQDSVGTCAEIYRARGPDSDPGPSSESTSSSDQDDRLSPTDELLTRGRTLRRKTHTVTTRNSSSVDHYTSRNHNPARSSLTGNPRRRRFLKRQRPHISDIHISAPDEHSGPLPFSHQETESNIESFTQDNERNTSHNSTLEETTATHSLEGETEPVPVSYFREIEEPNVETHSSSDRRNSSIAPQTPHPSDTSTASDRATVLWRHDYDSLRPELQLLMSSYQDEVERHNQHELDQRANSIIEIFHDNEMFLAIFWGSLMVVFVILVVDVFYRLHPYMPYFSNWLAADDVDW